jgi:hypothetical protein
MRMAKKAGSLYAPTGVGIILKDPSNKIYYRSIAISGFKTFNRAQNQSGYRFISVADVSKYGSATQALPLHAQMKLSWLHSKQVTCPQFLH